jgi:hypothetical protein
MSPTQASSDSFPRLTGASNFDVWKMRVCAALDGKNLLGFITREDYDGTSDPSEWSDEDLGNSPIESEIDSDAVDYDESDDDLKPASSSEASDEAGEIKSKTPPSVRSFAETRAVSKRSKPPRFVKPKPRRLSSHELRRLEAKTFAFLMKTMDNTHIRLVKDKKTSYRIFQTICSKYEGVNAHGDPYTIMSFLMRAKYHEGDDLLEFFIRYDDAIKAVDHEFREAEVTLTTLVLSPKKWISS